MLSRVIIVFAEAGYFGFLRALIRMQKKIH